MADIETINTELALADLETVEKTLVRVSRVAKSGDKEAHGRRRAATGTTAPQRKHEARARHTGSSCASERTSLC